MKMWIQFLSIVSSVVFLSCASLAGENKVGYIDIQKALQGIPAGQKVKKELETEFNKRKQNLDKKKAEIEKQGQELDKKRSVLSEEVLGKKQSELQQEMVQFQKSVNDNQMEMQKLQGQLLQPVFDKMQKVIEKVAADKGFSMVLEKSEHNVVFATKEVDITEDVVKALQ